MTRLYLVRHGETDWNKENRCQGCIDIELNEEGIRQAKAVASRLKDEEIDIIYSSTLKRAFRTAEIINTCINKEIIKDSSLNEINFGEWEGLTFDEMKLRPDYNYNEWRLNPHRVTFPGEGSLQKVSDRCLGFVKEIINSNSDKNILIVSHGGILKLVVLGILGIGLDAYSKFYMANASLSIIVLDKTRAYLKVLNDTCHYKPGTMPIF